MIIDAHQHFWDRDHPNFDHSWQELPQHAPICQTFMPGDLKLLMDEVGVDRMGCCERAAESDVRSLCGRIHEAHAIVF